MNIAEVHVIMGRHWLVHAADPRLGPECLPACMHAPPLGDGVGGDLDGVNDEAQDAQAREAKGGVLDVGGHAHGNDPAGRARGHVPWVGERDRVGWGQRMCACVFSPSRGAMIQIYANVKGEVHTHLESCMHASLHSLHSQLRSQLASFMENHLRAPSLESKST